MKVIRRQELLACHAPPTRRGPSVELPHINTTEVRREAYVKDQWTRAVEQTDGTTARVRTAKWGEGSGGWRGGGSEGRERSKAFGTKTATERHGAAMETDRERGEYIDPDAGKVRFEEVAERWLASRVVDPATALKYESSLRLHGPPAGPPQPTGNQTTASRSTSLESDSDLRKHLPDAHAGDGSGYYQALDFAGAFEDGVDLLGARRNSPPRSADPSLTCGFAARQLAPVPTTCRRLTELSRNTRTPA
ncbi:hypothetical protein EV648_113276 [Kribbella sp. VKM Ac-2568]|nr:hypothetical protein EV648_113276 [Kribbella sp. VKM Ac-2568]